MKLIYVEKGRMPTEKAYGYQICQMCEEFAKAGNKVELWVPIRENNIKENVFSLYGLEKKFTVKYIKSFDILKYRKYLGCLGFYLHSILFFIKLLFKRMQKETVIYTRISEIVWLFSLRGFKTIFEAHNWPESKIWLYKYFIKRASKIIIITHALKNLYLDNGFSEDKVLVAPDGVNLEKFNIKLSKEECCKKLNLPLDKKIIIYTGHLYDWKGAQTLADAAKFLERDNLIIFVGGREEDVKKFKKENKDQENILIVGKKLPKEIPFYLKSADALVLPNSSQKDISKFYTSPMKLFEYMASGRPVVASNLPSIREILNKNNSVLIEPDNPRSLARGIKKVLGNQELGDKIFRQAFQDVQNYTWEKRAKRIINFIKNI